ncbi:MAG: hypothetical protein D6830_03145 [Ignavibacteria bacterium]|nr:MAG: hypothetical protein D6830_03145 [Ignavibacteria bacterium]
MKSKKYNIEESILSQIISVAYGDADKETEEKISELILNDENAKQILDEYRTTANAVRKLKIAEAPISLEEKLFGNSVKLKSESKQHSLWDLILHPAMVMVYTAILFGLIFSNDLKHYQPENTYQFSQEEILRANKEAIASLMLVKNILTSTEHTLKHEILNDIGKPINIGLNTVNYLFEKGGKNEK